MSNALEWHLGAGIEYFFTRRVSLAFEGSYSLSRENLDLDLGEEDQINLVTWSEEIYRPHGSLQIFAPGASAPNTFCYQTAYRGRACIPGDLALRVNPEFVDPFFGQRYTCPTAGDFDRDGQIDLCWGKNVSPSPRGYTEPRGDIIVQGGRINLSAFTVGMGLRFHF